MEKIKNIPIEGIHGKPILTDIFYNKSKQQKSIVIFCHGYKGYKDWGPWNFIAEKIADKNLFFIKFNFAFNGGTAEEPIDFPDLKSFGNNNYVKELDDLNAVIDWVLNNKNYKEEIDANDITVIGHSRGGGIVTLKAAEDSRIKRIISWAGVSDFGSRFPKDKDLIEWKSNGVYYVLNGRTKQKMPHYFQFYTNFKANEERLNIQAAAEKMNIPHLIIHGSNDEAVNIKEAENLNSWNPNSSLVIIRNGTHTFNTAHPFIDTKLPETMEEVINHSVQFILK